MIPDRYLKTIHADRDHYNNNYKKSLQKTEQQKFLEKLLKDTPQKDLCYRGLAC